MARIESLKLLYDGERLWDSGDHVGALQTWCKIAEVSSRILFNIGCAHLSVNNLKDALQVDLYVCLFPISWFNTCTLCSNGSYLGTEMHLVMKCQNLRMQLLSNID